MSDPNNESKLYYQQPFKSLCGPPQYAGGGHYTTIPASSQALRLPTEPSKAYQYINERQIPIDELGNSRLKLIGLGRGFLMKRQNVMFNQLESDIKVLTSCIEKIQANSQSKTENLVEEQYDEMSMMVKQLEKETTKSATDDTKTLSKQDLNHNKPANIELAKKVENKQSKSTVAGSVGLGRGGNPQSRQRERNLSDQNVGGLACQSTVKANIVSPESVNEKKGFSPKKQSDIIQGGIEPDKVQRKATKSPPARCVGYGRGGNPQTRQRERSLMRTPVGGLVCQSAQVKVTVKSEMPDKACHQEESKEDSEKKLFRKLTKKLNAIERLRMKRKQGEKLTKEEEQKIKLRALIKRELACLS